MAITKQKKESILKSTKDALQTTSAVFVGFKGVTVHEANDLRAALKREGVKFTVVKKTLLKRSLDEKGLEGQMPELPGEVAFAYLKDGEDITAPARSLNSFVKKLQGKLSYLGGFLEGKYLNQAETISVAMIPPIPVLQGMFVNIINSPIQRFAVALGEVVKTKN